MLRLKPAVEWQYVDDEVVVLDLNSSSYLAVNNTGAALWALVAEGTTEGQLGEELSSRFNLGRERAQVDAAAFVDRLRSLNLVEEP